MKEVNVLEQREWERQRINEAYENKLEEHVTWGDCEIY